MKVVIESSLNPSHEKFNQMMRELNEVNENVNNITYSNILSNIDIVKDINLTKKLMSLSYKELSGGIKAVWNYPNENPSNVVIAFENSEPIGVITNTNGNQNIFIKPEYRKLGIGSKLKDIMYKMRPACQGKFF